MRSGIATSLIAFRFAGWSESCRPRAVHPPGRYRLSSVGHADTAAARSFGISGPHPRLIASNCAGGPARSVICFQFIANIEQAVTGPHRIRARRHFLIAPSRRAVSDDIWQLSGFRRPFLIHFSSRISVRQHLLGQLDRYGNLPYLSRESIVIASPIGSFGKGTTQCDSPSCRPSFSER